MRLHIGICGTFRSLALLAQELGHEVAAPMPTYIHR